MEHFSEVFRKFESQSQKNTPQIISFPTGLHQQKTGPSSVFLFFQGLKGNPSLQEWGGAFFWSSVGGNSKFICFKPNIFGDVSIFFNTKDLFETSLYEVWKVIVLRIVDGSP